MEYSSNDVKQLFRSIYTLVKQQDECKPTLSIESMLANEFLEEHRQLVGRCVTLIFEDYETVGKKAREILWRKGYYDLIVVFKRHYHQLQQQQKQLIVTGEDTVVERKEQQLKHGVERLLLDGMNHLKVIVLRLAQIFNLEKLKHLVNYELLENYDDDLLVRESSCYENLGLNEEHNEDEKKIIYTKQEISFALESIHSLLTALGDLHRYYCEFDLNTIANVKDVTAKYYWEAFKLNPKIGITQNQLGTLYNGQNYNLDSVYHYLYSLCCPIPFDCSELNVSKIFQKNIRYLENENGGDDVEEEDFTVREFVAKFLLVVDVFFYDKSVTDFTSLCHSVLIDFKNVLGARKLIDDEYYMTEEIIFKIVSILFFCMYKIKINNSDKIHSLNAFLVALCSELLEYCTMAVEKYVVENVREDKKFREMYLSLYQRYDEEVRKSRQSSKETTAAIFMKDQKSSSGVEECNGSEDCSNKENEENDKKSQASSKQTAAKKKHVRRRRRVLTNESESDLSDQDDQSDFQLDSDSDASSVSSFDSYDDFSDEDEEEQREDLCKEPKEPGKHSVESTTIDKAQDREEHEKEYNNNSMNPTTQLKFKKRYLKLNPNIIVEFAEQERTMRSLKVLFDWLQTNMDILLGCYQSNPEFIHNIMKLLNHFNIDIFSNRYYFPRKLVTIQGIRDDFRSLFDIRRSIPLDEDIAMKQFPLFEITQEEFDWESNYRLEVTDAEQSFLRAMKMVDFGFSLCKSKKFDYAFCPKARDFSLNSKKQRKTQQHRSEDHNKKDRGATRNRGNRIRKREQQDEKHKMRKKSNETEQRCDNKTRRNQNRNRQQNERRRGDITETQKSSQEVEIKQTPGIITKKGYLKHRCNGDLGYTGKQSQRDNSALANTTTGEIYHQENINELMGQLWLRSEVKTLESKVKKVVNITLTPYLMVDSKCLTEYTYIVKNLVKTKKFVILIPTAVLSDLDELKKHSDGARNAIKWLEFEFSKGNRFLRSQKNHEVLPMPPIRVPKKLDRDAAVFHQIVQFCNHIVTNHADKDSTDIITYLSGESLQDKKLYNSTYIGILEAIPVKFEQIVTFYASYKRK